MMDTVEKFLKKLDTWQPRHKMDKGYLNVKGDDPKIFRKRRQKPCYCGGHSCGKKQLTRHSNFIRYSYRLLKRQKMKGRTV